MRLERTVGLALFCYYGSGTIALVNADMFSISNDNALHMSVADLVRQIAVCSHRVVHAYFIKFQLADGGEKTPKSSVA